MARVAGFATALAVLVVLVAGCGIGPDTDEGKISHAADTYLRSLAKGDVRTACKQLTVEAKASLDGACRPALRKIAARVGADRLDAAADGGVDIEVNRARASAVVRELDAGLMLVRTGKRWRIDSGYRLDGR